MMIDPVFMIREESTNSIIALSKNLFDQSWLERIVETKLNELASNERFMLRIQTIHVMNQLKENVSQQLVDSVFARHLFTLASDNVPNIRFNVSKTISVLYPLMQATNQAQAREVLSRMADQDSDFDAKFYAQKTLETIQAA